MAVRDEPESSAWRLHRSPVIDYQNAFQTAGELKKGVPNVAWASPPLFLPLTCQ